MSDLRSQPRVTDRILPSRLSDRLLRGRFPFHRRTVLRFIGLLFAAVALPVLSADLWTEPSQAIPSSLSEQQRFGFVATSPNWWQKFDVYRLRAGWYVDTTASACRFAPAGVDRAFLLSVREGYVVDPQGLGSQVDANPGAMWLIGNEPDCIHQDNVRPEEYARIYHDLYTFIKDRDPASQISPGGIVQPTPLRLEWLDRVLTAYQARYGGAMPVDAWNIHNAILNEMDCDYDDRNCWGAEIPPGIDAPFGVERDPQDNDNMDIFGGQIWAFREWMAKRGYRGFPLIVTEYGILMPEWLGFNAERVTEFMGNTFDFFSTVTDPNLGDPTDGYRLVQRWAWFSLDVPSHEQNEAGFNGNLFDPQTAELTESGLYYESRTSSFPPLNYIDLSVGGWVVPSIPLLTDPTQTVSPSVQVKIVNVGPLPSGSFLVKLACVGPVNHTLAQTVNLPKDSSEWLTFTLPNLTAGGYRLSVEIDPDNQVVEAAECNNRSTRSLLVAKHRQYAPLVLRRWSSSPLGGAGSASGQATDELRSPWFPLPSTP